MQWYWIVALALLALALLWLGLGYYAFAAFCVRKRRADPGSQQSLEHGPHREYAQLILNGQSWAAEHAPERVETQSFDGLRLVARFIPNEARRGVALLFHGFRSAWNVDFACAFANYYALGLSLLVVDQRAHGESEGRYITYGIRERQDVLSWVRYVNERCGEDTPLLLAGLSMGATTVQMACGSDLPQNVRAVVADCGFTAPEAIFRHVLRMRRLPGWLFLPQLRLFCKLLAGFETTEYSTLKAQRRNGIPTFFAHGDADRLVPCRMSRANFAACAAPKRIFTVHGAGHGMCFLLDRDGYVKALTDFLEEIELLPAAE